MKAETLNLYIGDNYDSQNVKILLVGESHYGNSDNIESNNFTAEIINKYTKHEINHRYFTMIPSIIMDVPGNSVDRTFWRNVAFFNYIADFMPGPGIAPSEDQWVAGVPRLCESLNFLAPDKMIVLGKRLWCAMIKYVPEFVCSEFLEFECYKFEIRQLEREGRSPLLATYITHPSRANRYEWHEVTQTFLGGWPEQRK